jgi:hypothetical protein
MISFALISLPDNLSVSNDSASSHARVSDLSRASVSTLAVQQSLLNVDGPTVAEFKQGLSQRDGIGSTADRNSEVDRWRLESNLRGLNNRPDDHDLSPVDWYSMIILTESPEYNDCIGDGPPLYDGNPLSFQDKDRGVQSAAAEAISRHSAPGPSSRDDFAIAIAIICALPEERDTVEALMKRDYRDERQRHGKVRADDNSYTVGELDGKPVVLVAPRDMGTTNTRDPARWLRVSFPAITAEDECRACWL